MVVGNDPEFSSSCQASLSICFSVRQNDMIGPRPELSVGQKCEHQPIGSTFYEATGPALEAFEKIAPIIFKIIEVSKLDLERGIPACP